jgi:hypothetical protein
MPANPQMKQFLDDDIFQARLRLLGEFQIEPDPS